MTDDSARHVVVAGVGGTAEPAAAPGRILVVNAGSSSLKLRVLGPADEITTTLDLDQWDGRPDHRELGQFLCELSGVDAVGHRVVHGGSRFGGATLIDDEVTAAIADLSDLASLHQPRALAAIDAVRAVLHRPSRNPPRNPPPGP